MCGFEGEGGIVCVVSGRECVDRGNKDQISGKLEDSLDLERKRDENWEVERMDRRRGGFQVRRGRGREEKRGRSINTAFRWDLASPTPAQHLILYLVVIINSMQFFCTFPVYLRFLSLVYSLLRALLLLCGSVGHDPPSRQSGRGGKHWLRY